MAELTMTGTRGKGQMFIIGAVLFSMAVLLTFTASQQAVYNPSTGIQGFFSQTLDESTSAFNDALAENHSAEFASIKMHQYDRFLERQSREKGIDYSTYTLVVVPENGEAVFTNLMEESLDVSLKTGGNWNNQTVETGESFATSFDPGTVSVELVIDDQDENHSFTSLTPRLLKHSSMDAGDEKWTDTVLG